MDSGFDDCGINLRTNSGNGDLSHLAGEHSGPVEGERYERLRGLEEQKKEQDKKEVCSYSRFSWKAFKEYLTRPSMID